jgi:lysyl-tRNA synthetase class II
MQEFTMVEHYAVYWDFEENMRFTESMFEYLFENLKMDKIVKI